MAEFGLIGYPLEHSFSPGWFAKKFQREGITHHQYRAFPLVRIQDFSDLVRRHPDLAGLNVTIPYKQLIIPFLDRLSPEAIAVSAVNTLAREKGEWVGYNTDIIGFRETLKPLLKTHHRHALILGSGGASLAVGFVLDQLGIEYRVVSRTPFNNQLAYDALDAVSMDYYSVIINTTPVGMFPHVNHAPTIPYPAIGPQHLLYDLVYNPAETQFLQKGKAQGAQVVNGLGMLEMQAEASWDIWNANL
ncbi:MAG: shikimate dehydrogenase family protein [Salibacteraceae bacterium]